MANQRKKGLKLVGFFANEEEAAALFAAAKARGQTVADFLRQVIRDSSPTDTPKKKSAVKRA